MKGFRQWLILLALFSFSLFLHANSENSTYHGAMVTAGVVINFPPQYSLDAEGNPQGFAIDSMDAIAEIAGVLVQYKVYDNWGELVNAFKNGEIDIIPNNGITKARQEYSDYSEPLETFAISVFVREDSVGFHSLSDLENRVIGVVDRNAAVRFLREQNHQIKIYPDFSNLLIDLVSGRIDAAAYPEPVVWQVAQEAGLDHRVRPLSPPLIEIKRAMAFPKGNTELLNLFDKAVSEFIHSEQYEVIHNKWFAKPKPFWDTRRVLTLLISLTLVLIMVAILWRNHSLRRINVRLIQETNLRDKAERELKTLNTELEAQVEQRTAELAQRNEILNSIDHLREQFIKDADPLALFPELLENLLKLTKSKYGVIAEVLSNNDRERYLKVYAICVRSGKDASGPRYENLLEEGVEVSSLDDLFSEALNSGLAVITNAPQNDSRFSEVIKGHPELDSFMGIPVYFGSKLVGVIGLANRKGGYTQDNLDTLKPVISVLGQIIVGRRDQEARFRAECELKLQASTDSLTGIANRRSFEAKLSEEVNRANRYNEPLSLLMLDIDHFKQVNDKYGHDAGDLILIELIQQLQVQLRETDFIARWGGEEFMIILPETTMATAETLAERLRQAIEGFKFSHHPETTISLGLTTYHKGEEAGVFVSRVDTALYDAKKSGRNRVSFSPLHIVSNE